jgi:hypothetical protein
VTSYNFDFDIAQKKRSHFPSPVRDKTSSCLWVPANVRLGHKRKCALQKAMSALRPKATSAVVYEEPPIKSRSLNRSDSHRPGTHWSVSAALMVHCTQESRRWCTARCCRRGDLRVPLAVAVLSAFGGKADMAIASLELSSIWGKATVVAKLLISSGRNHMLRIFASAGIFVVALGLAGLPARAQSSASKSLRVAQNISPTQQEEERAAKSVACRKQAKEQKLSGSKRRAFLKDCIRK